MVRFSHENIWTWGFLLVEVFLFYFWVFVYLFCFLGPHVWQTEVPRLGAAAASYSHSHSNAGSKPCQAMSVMYTTAHGNTRYLTHCDVHHSSWQRQILNSPRPGIEPTSSWIPVRFITTEPHWELH